jgi:hypothetical protein
MTEQDRWKNRRRMAWICMIAAIGYPLLVLGSNSRALGDIAVPFYMFVSAVVGAYIGFAAWDDKNVMNRKRSYDHYDDPMDRSGRDYRNNLDYTNARF